MPHPNPILPGATLGILGSGQLGRMFAQAAARFGYQVHVFSPRKQSPTGQVASRETVADYEDAAAVAQFARSVDVVTLEFENVPSDAVEVAARYAPVRPSSGVLHVTQHRLREKEFLRRSGIPCAPFAPVRSADDLTAAIAEVGLPAVLKTCSSGYDGKGQAIIRTPEEANEAWKSLGQQPAVLEAFVDYQQELSVLVARSAQGEVACYPPIANDHLDHILDVSTLPYDKWTSDKLGSREAEATEIACTIVRQLEVVGLVCIEFFLTEDDRLLVNEIAPRPHNSGHLTIEACETSQFEQQVRAICGLPLGSTGARSPAAMANLLGQLWAEGEPDWPAALGVPNVRLHLYGKTEALPGRKMGHLTALANSPAAARQYVELARKKLVFSPQQAVDPTSISAAITTQFR